MNVRPSPIAGHWYPGSYGALRRDIDGYLDQADVRPPAGQIRGVVVPHAGLRYSGSVAAYAFKCLRGLRPRLVAVISPYHHQQRAPLLTTAHDAYETPLGQIEVDREAVAAVDSRLRARIGIGLAPLLRDPEHALEIELPFLQRVLGTFRLLPIMMRDQHAPLARALGLSLAGVLKADHGLLVASSDLSHFYDQELARVLDQEVLRRLELMNPEAVLAAETEGAGFACGRGAIAAVLWAAMALGADRVTPLHYATSGDVSGDYGAVVGYGAAVIWQAEGHGVDNGGISA